MSLTHEQRIRELESAVSKLSEFFDAVQINATYLTESGTTRGVKRGSGNYYARQGLCREFCVEDEQIEQARCIAKELDPPDEFQLS